LKAIILDLVLTNIPDRIISVDDQGRLGSSNHIILSVKIMVSERAEPTTETIQIGAGPTGPPYVQDTAAGNCWPNWRTWKLRLRGRPYEMR